MKPCLLVGVKLITVIADIIRGGQSTASNKAECALSAWRSHRTAGPTDALPEIRAGDNFLINHHVLMNVSAAISCHIQFVQKDVTEN